MHFRILAMLSLLLAVSCSKKETTEGPDPLVVGMEMTYPPFEMRNAAGEPDGISVRLAEGLADHLGRPLELKDIAWDGIIPSLTSGKIDLIISSMTRTDERAKTIDFTDGYVTNGLCLLVGKAAPIKSVEDLKARGSEAKIAVKLTTTGHLWAKEHLPEATLIVLADAASCALEVGQGKADAFIYDQVSIFRHAEVHPETTRALLDPIREETWAIGVNKGDDELRESVNEFLSKARDAGTFDALGERYMTEEKKAFEEAGVPFIFH